MSPHHRVRTFLLLLTTLTLQLTPFGLHGIGHTQSIAGEDVERLWTGFRFVEGPVWKEGVGLLFSDIHSSTIYQWSRNDSTMSVYLKPSDSSNGLAFDHEGNLILTQMQKRRIARQEPNGTITPLVSTYNGKRFNCPNDIVVSSSGAILFTDPDFNVPAGQSRELSFKGIFRLSPSGTLQVIDSTFDKPNGICFSPDESRLYVNESAQHKIYVWDVVDDSAFTNKRLFYTIPQTGYADGMKVDPSGNVYCTGPGGIWVVSPLGTYVTLIATPQNPSNCAWGDADRKTLYITAQTSIYRVRPGISTEVDGDNRSGPDHFELQQNYPNPFNSSTVIRSSVPSHAATGRAVHGTSLGSPLVAESRESRSRQTAGPDQLSEDRHVKIAVYDLLGREVVVLFAGWRAAGSYQDTFSASSLSSGVYLYRLQAGNYVQTRKMLFVR